MVELGDPTDPADPVTDPAAPRHMRAAPLKNDCLVCGAPEAIRVAMNAAIWPGDGVMRAVGYRQDAVDIAHDSGNPTLARINVKTIARHADHVEASWREIPANGRLRGEEVPLKADFLSLVDQGSQLSAVAMAALLDLLRADPKIAAVLMTKEVISMAKLGLTAATAGEVSKLKRNQQNIDVLALFAVSSGHTPPVAVDVDDDSPPLEVLKLALSTERKLLAERAG